MDILIIWLGCSIGAAAVAAGKGRSGIGWLLLGLLFGIFALIIVACLPSLRTQEFVMANPDGTVAMIRSVPRGSQGGRYGPQRNDWKGMLTAIAIAFGLVLDHRYHRPIRRLTWSTKTKTRLARSLATSGGSA